MKADMYTSLTEEVSFHMTHAWITLQKRASSNGRPLRDQCPIKISMQIPRLPTDHFEPQFSEKNCKPQKTDIDLRSKSPEAKARR